MQKPKKPILVACRRRAQFVFFFFFFFCQRQTAAIRVVNAVAEALFLITVRWQILRKRVAAGFHMEGSSRSPGPETTGAVPTDGNGCLLLEAVTPANNYSQEKQQSLELERQYWGPREGKRSEMESNNIRRWEWVWTGSGGALREEGCGCSEQGRHGADRPPWAASCADRRPLCSQRSWSGLSNRNAFWGRRKY